MEIIRTAYGETLEATDWDGTAPGGRVWENFDPDDGRQYKIDRAGNVYYICEDGLYYIWCVASRLSRHVHRLNQIAWRK